MGMKDALAALLGRNKRSSDPAGVPAATEAPRPKVAADITLHSVLASLRAQHQHNLETLARNPQRRKIERVVDNRVMILGLADLYRAAIKAREHTQLLPAARAVAARLGVTPDPVPPEGHYSHDEKLTEYFRLVRALQHTSSHENARPEMAEFALLEEVFSSPLFGASFAKGTLLPFGMDPVAFVMLNNVERSAQTVMDLAVKVAQQTDDFSLVGMACLARDPVTIVALRDPVRIPYEGSTFGNPPIPTYAWQVDAEIAERAERFIATFLALFGEELPEPTAENADLYGASFYEQSGFVGRCVRISLTESSKGHYYWGIFAGDDGKPRIHEFWSHEPWDTDRYRQAMPSAKGNSKL
jgi:hypothetical protein